MFKRKPLHRLAEEADGGAHGLRRALGAMNLVSLGVGVIVGAGIFVVTGTAAAQYAGPGIVLSFLLSAIACAFAGLCYAEFASMIPIAGSAYTYAYATLGEIVAWIIGWDLILEYLFGASAVAVLRYRHPEAPRAFRCPRVPVVPILGALLSLLQMVSLPEGTWLRLLVWMAAGLALYFAYGRRHSRLLHHAAPEAPGV
jgi:amino acid transporter